MDYTAGGSKLGWFVNLYTSCNSCGTVFQVTTANLKEAGGQVRCGYCHEVFDAFDSLTAQIPRNPPREVESPIMESRQTKKTFEDHVSPDEAKYESLEVEENLDGDDADVNLYETEFRGSPPPTGNLLRLAILFLSVLAVLQWVYLERQEIVQKYPGLYETIVDLCNLPECGSHIINSTVWLDIQSSDLLLDKSANNESAELRLLIRNRATFAVRYPDLELNLLNSDGKEVARHLFIPIDYLDDHSRNSAFKGDSEASLSIGFESPMEGITEYRLNLLPHRNLKTTR